MDEDEARLICAGRLLQDQPRPQGSGHSDGCEVAVRRLTCMVTVESAWLPAHLLL
jgi:hypothetical protein